MPPAAIERLGKGQPILTTGRMFQTELLPGHLRQIPQRGRIRQIHPVGRPGCATTECTITLLPPLVIAEYDPTLFFAALDNAGTFGILVLFGMVPAAMAWQQRYGLRDELYAGPASKVLRTKSQSV